MAGCLFGCRHHAKNVLIHRKIAVECVQAIKPKGKTLFSRPDQNRTHPTRQDPTTPDQVTIICFHQKERARTAPASLLHSSYWVLFGQDTRLRGVLIMYEQYASAKKKEIWSQMCSAGLKRVSKRP